MKYIATIDGQEYQVELLKNSQVNVNGEIYSVDLESISEQNVHSLIINGKSFEAHVSEEQDPWHVLIHGTVYQTTVYDEREKRLLDSGIGEANISPEYTLKAPMPGLIVDIQVQVGDIVEKGDVILILESMKMQNELKTPQPGKIVHVCIEAGDNVEGSQLLAVIHSEGYEG